jgi:molecular chaperone GrpE
MPKAKQPPSGGQGAEEVSQPQPGAEEPVNLEGEDLATIKRQLEEERQKAESYLANWQRSQADFINYKRRTEQERSDVAKFANAMLILNLLPVLDDLERALATVPTSMAGLTWFDGIRLIHRKLMGILETQGLRAIEAEGQDFDPNLHEAVMHGEGEEGKVLEELQKGYKLHDRVIRPAMVKVGSKKAEAADKQE